MRDIETPKAKIRVYEGLAEMASHARAPKLEVEKRLSYFQRDYDALADADRDAWAGATNADALAWCETGNLDGVEKADALLSRFETLAFATHAKGWREDVSGAIPNVPAFIAGHPLNMRRREKIENAAAPITIFCDIFASCSYTGEQITKRGAAVLALVRILSMRRPVELWLGGCAAHRSENGKLVAPVVKIDTAPLDLARAAYALTHPAFLRRVAFRCDYLLEGGAHVPPFKESLRAPLAPLLGDAETLILPPLIGCNDGENKLSWTNPEQWIIRQIEALAPEMLDAA